MNPAEDMTVYIPRIPAARPAPAPLLPAWVGRVLLLAVFAAMGAVAAFMVGLMVLILTSP